MSYLAAWTVYIEGEDLDPFEVAKRAREQYEDPMNQMWAIHNMTAMRSTVVDLHAMREIPGIKPPDAEH